MHLTLKEENNFFYLSLISNKCSADSATNVNVQLLIREGMFKLIAANKQLTCCRSSSPPCCSTSLERTWKPRCCSHWKRRCRKPQTATVGKPVTCLPRDWSRTSGLSSGKDDRDSGPVFFNDLVADAPVQGMTKKCWITLQVYTFGSKTVEKVQSVDVHLSECFISYPSLKHTLGSDCDGTYTNNTLPCRDFTLTRTESRQSGRILLLLFLFGSSAYSNLVQSILQFKN